MRVTRITIDRREYSLPAEQSLDAIMASITEQVRAGGGFIELVRTPQRAVSVFVSPGTSLSIEVQEVEDVGDRTDEQPQPAERSWLDPFDLA